MRYELNFDEDKVNDVLDTDGVSYDLKECCELLNEQQEMIDQLEKENTNLIELAEELGVKIVVVDDE